MDAVRELRMLGPSEDSVILTASDHDLVKPVTLCNRKHANLHGHSCYNYTYVHLTTHHI